MAPNEKSAVDYRPITFSEVLTTEFSELNLIPTLHLTDEEWAEIEKLVKDGQSRETLDLEGYLAAYQKHLNTRLKIDPYKSLTPEQQIEQLPRRHERQALLVKKIYKLLDRNPKNDDGPSALCLSGGGIRSATFCLGVVQTLARHGLLDKFHYLSTVSGGGYIGSWLSAWISREKNSVKAVEDKLCGRGLETGQVEAEPVRYLRTYSNYMSPRVGLFSTDMWTLIITYFRNLLLNWTVFIPLIAAVLIVPKLFVGMLGSKLVERNSSILFWTAIALLAVGVAFANLMRPSLRQYSFWFLQQSYRTDDIGYLRPKNRVGFFCVLPVLVFAGLLTLAGNDLITSEAGNPLSFEAAVSSVLPGLIALGAAVFASAYILSSLLLLPNYIRYRKTAPVNISKLMLEPIFCIMSGAVGGFIASIAAGVVAVTGPRDLSASAIAVVGPIACLGIYSLRPTRIQLLPMTDLEGRLRPTFHNRMRERIQLSAIMPMRPSKQQPTRGERQVHTRTTI